MMYRLLCPGLLCSEVGGRLADLDWGNNALPRADRGLFGLSYKRLFCSLRDACHAIVPSAVVTHTLINDK